MGLKLKLLSPEGEDEAGDENRWPGTREIDLVLVQVQDRSDAEDIVFEPAMLRRSFDPLMQSLVGVVSPKEPSFSCL